MLPLTRSRNRARFFGIPFSPLSLFAAGEQGTWYDPNDFSTLFQDSEGTIPVTGVEQVVGLMLDKSKGLVLGPELFSTFSTVTSPWTAQGGGVWSIDGSQAGNRDLSVSPFFTINNFYVVTFTLSGVTGGTVSVFAGEGTGVSLGNGTYTYRRTASQNYLIFRASAGVAATVSAVSVRELPGNHATSTGAARPTLSARKNWLIGTDTLATQNVTTRALPYVLSFYGTGSITLSGTATGTLTGTGVNDRVYVDVTPTSGTLTLTVSGTVTNAQLEFANEFT